ncbi:flagellar hook protein FlgE [Pseudomonas huanghezhanensis]|uniref:flagellar hook protein FlgE n=1 Tax=Pseudomonas huanghezhanensis TaxID=3002903 RepID=UPI0022860443|nr:flagellar hook protein FlgE [Pseudomonas sp. BSw22131]
MSFNIAVAGLKASHKRLEVAGNNIANVGTAGFKSSRAEFSAVYASTHLGGGAATGSGVRLANVSQNFSAGSILTGAERQLDMRIQGKGFFVMSDGGSLSYSRAGAFQKDANDFVVDSHGSRLQGYGVNAKGEVVSGMRTDLMIGSANLSPKATSEIGQTINLDASAASLAALPVFSPDDPGTYTRVHVQTIQDAGMPAVKEVKGKDASGNEVIITHARAAIPPRDHELKHYVVKADDAQWTSYVLIDGVNPFDPSSRSPLQMGLTTSPGGHLVLSAANAAVDKVSDTELSLRNWVPAQQVNGSWNASGAANAGPVPLALIDGATPLLNDADALMTRPVPPFDPNDTTTFTKRFPSPIYDSLGNRHDLDQYFVKEGSNSWTLHVLVNGRNPADPTSTTPVTASVVFDSNGAVQSLTGGAGLSANNGKLTLGGWLPARQGDAHSGGHWKPNGAAGNVDGIAIDLNKLTQHNAETARLSPQIDGHAAGHIVGLTIDGRGIMSASFDNGLHRQIGQVMLASFANEQGLQPTSDTRWRETHDSGVAEYDGAGTGSLGAVVSGSLEGSNVQLTDELVELIQAQTSYQANSKTLSTEAELLQTLIRAT